LFVVPGGAVLYFLIMLVIDRKAASEMVSIPVTRSEKADAAL
jgi:hypothetical protein